MSLILDALRKVEREKNTGEPGVVVVGSVPWGGGGSRRSLALVLTAAALLALAAGGGWLLRRAPGSKGEAPAGVPAATPPPALSTPPAVSPPAPSGTASTPATAPSPRPLALPVPEAAGERLEPPAAALPAPSDDIRLNAISRRDGRPVALINDRLAFEGDSFGGIKVLRIGEAEVEVEVRGKRRVLRF